MDFETGEQLETYFQSKIMPKLLEYCAKRAEDNIKALITFHIPYVTKSFTPYITHKKEGEDVVVFIDYERMTREESAEPVFDEKGHLVEWGRFCNTFDGKYGRGSAFDDTWRNELVTFRMAEWLEKGGGGHIGNQPISANHWFTKSVDNIKRYLPLWVRDFFDALW